MMSAVAYTPIASRASSRLGLFNQVNMHLAVAFHPDWTGGVAPESALHTLHAAGVDALELNLPPTLTTADAERWQALIALAQPQFTLHLHAPLPPHSEGWSVVHILLSQIAAAQAAPPVVVVHAPQQARPFSATDQAVAWLQQLVVATPAPTLIALEQGWNWAASASWGTRWRRWRAQAARRALSAGRPTGIGSGQGATTNEPTVSITHTAKVLDPPLNLSRLARMQRHGAWSAAGTRDAALGIVQTVADCRMCLAWDVAHDWLGGPWSGNAAWTTVPSAAFLEHVGYVRLHDVADDGTDHLPLVIGNVPYTTQLRALQRAGFDGPVCLTIRHTAHAARHGSRADLQAQSLSIARRVLKLESR